MKQWYPFPLRYRQLSGCELKRKNKGAKLTEIRHSGNIFHQIGILVRGVGIFDLAQCLCNERGIIIAAGLKI